MTTYANLDGSLPNTDIGRLLKWRLTSKPRREPPGYATPQRPNDGAALASLEPHMTWIGHATFVLRLGGKLIATDPIWSTRLATLRRAAPPGVPFEAVPRLDIVTVSHAHYDHLDMPTLKRIGPEALFVVPLDVGELLRRAGLPKVVELGWWQTHEVDGIRITLVPAQHWSMRFPWDKNQRLWGGFVYEAREGTAYHAGDTAWNERVFTEIAANFPGIDWAMLPVGAYEPEWFMSAQHMGPEDAGRAWEVLGAGKLCAMHWGTFKLTDELLGEPPERLRAWWTKREHSMDRLWIFDVGETRRLVRARENELR